jgi:hypothetical protein
LLRRYKKKMAQGSIWANLQHLKLKREQIDRHTAVATNDDAIKFVASNQAAQSAAALPM